MGRMPYNTEGSRLLPADPSEWEPVEAFATDADGRVLVCENCGSPLGSGEFFEADLRTVELARPEDLTGDGLSPVGAAHVWPPRFGRAGYGFRWWLRRTLRWWLLPRDVRQAELHLRTHPCHQTSPLLRRMAGR